MRAGGIAPIVLADRWVLNIERGGTPTARLKSGATQSGVGASSARRDFRPTAFAFRSGPLNACRYYIHGIQRRRPGDKQPIPFRTPKGHIRD